MKNSIKIPALVVLISALVFVPYFIWSNYFGTALENRIKVGGAAAKSARTAVGRIDAVLTKAEAFPESWAGLTFNEAEEAKRILEDSGSNRGYKVDALRDASASKIQKDIIAAETELNSGITEARKAIKTIEGLSWYLPDSERIDYRKAKEETGRAIKRGEAMAVDLRELKYDVDIWGFLSISLRINGKLLASFDKVSADLGAGDNAAAAAGVQDILVGVNESVTWLTHGKQELTNIGAYSKDSDAILAFIGEAKTTAEMFNNAAAAGARGETAKASKTREAAERKLAELRKTAHEKSTGVDFITWFRANAERRLTKV